MATKKSDIQAAKAQAAAKKTGRAAPKGKAAPKAKAQAKAEPKVRAAPIAAGPRHPRGRLLAAHGSKEALAKTIAPTLARADEDTDAIAARLRTASNRQLLRLAAASQTVKQRWGTREKMIEAIGAAQKKSKDKDYLARLDTYSLPRLVELATTAARAARA
jgi:hypothetical protein